VPHSSVANYIIINTLPILGKTLIVSTIIDTWIALIKKLIKKWNRELIIILISISYISIYCNTKNWLALSAEGKIV